MGRPFDQAHYQVIKEMVGGRGRGRIEVDLCQHHGGQKCSQGKFGQQCGISIHITVIRANKSTPYDETFALRFNNSKRAISKLAVIFPKILANDIKRSKCFFYCRNFNSIERQNSENMFGRI